MLFAAGLQPSCNLVWAEAVNTSIYILNRRPRELDKQIPYELWTKKKVDLKHLRKFGSDVFVYAPKQFRSKFESKTKKMIFVGYDGDSNNYRVMDPQTFKITITKDAIVNEENRVNNSIERSRSATFLVEDVQEEQTSRK